MRWGRPIVCGSWGGMGSLLPAALLLREAATDG